MLCPSKLMRTIFQSFCLCFLLSWAIKQLRIWEVISIYFSNCDTPPPPPKLNSSHLKSYQAPIGKKSSSVHHHSSGAMLWNFGGGTSLPTICPTPPTGVAVFHGGGRRFRAGCYQCCRTVPPGILGSKGETDSWKMQKNLGGSDMCRNELVRMKPYQTWEIVHFNWLISFITASRIINYCWWFRNPLNHLGWCWNPS